MVRLPRLIAILVLGTAAFSASAEKIDLESHWDISTAFTKRTAFRQKICLNGFWQFSPLQEAGTEPEGPWGYMKVPGGTRMQFYVYDADRKKDEAATEKTRLAPFALYRRTFDLPQGAAQGRVHLNVEYLRDKGTIYLNGNEIATIMPKQSIPDRMVDITDAVQAGRNELRIFITNAPAKPTKKDYQGGICDDVWLVLTPAGPRIENARVRTDVDAKQLKLHLTLTPADRSLSLSGTLYEHNTAAKARGEAVFSIAPQELKIGDNSKANVTIDLSPHWERLRLWNFEDPALYQLELNLAANGDPVDQIVERIGLRETKIIGHEFYLNGQRTHVRDCYKFLEKFGRGRFAGFADERVFRYRLREYKKSGWNLCHSFDAFEPYLGNILDVMDEEGLMFYPLIVGISGYRSIKPNPDLFRKITEAIEHYHNHPSIILWSMFTTGNFRSDEDIRNPWAWTMTYGPVFSNERTDKVTQGHQRYYKHIKQSDPYRPTLFGTLTNFGDGITGFYYPNMCTPTQELIAWPSKWAAVPGRKAQWGLESTFRLPNCWGDQAAGKRAGWTEQLYENGARSLGPAAYTLYANERPNPNPMPFIKTPQPGDKMVGEVIMASGMNPLFMERTGDSVMRVVRSWRAYDVACAAMGDEFHWFYDVYRSDDWPSTAVADKYRVALAELKTPGVRADEQNPYERVVNIQEPALPRIAPKSVLHDKLRLNATGPFLAFLGHKGREAGQFTWADHAYVSGETVAKQVILINDHAEPRVVSFEVSLDGKPIAGEQFELQAGEIRFIPFQFEAPSVSGKSKHMLSLAARIAPGQLAQRPGNVAAEMIRSFPPGRNDEMALQVFPTAQTSIEAPSLRIALYDPVGKTATLMDIAALSYDLISDDTTDLGQANLLVVGREGFTDGFRRLAARLGVEDKLTSGQIDMLVFEQHDETAAFDRDLYNIGARFTFRVDSTHPALAGLDDTDLANWRGQSDLDESAPPFYSYYKPGTRYFPKWTNEGSVCTFGLAKPEYGNFRVIVDCWFDLNYAALCEVFRGAGSVMFCQLDVTNHRFGTDPAATRIVRNLFDYYNHRADGEKVDPFGPVYVQTGDAVAQQVLDARHVKAEPFGPQAARGTLVLHAKAQDPEQVRKFVAGGGTVLYLTDPQLGLHSAMVGKDVTAKAVSNLTYAIASDDRLLQGVSQSELHFKGRPEVLGIEGPSQLTADGVISRISMGYGYILTVPWVDPAAAEKLQLMRVPKVARLYSTLLTNLGVAQGGVRLSPQQKPEPQGELIAGWDFEDGKTEPFSGGELATDRAATGAKSLLVGKQQRTWCSRGTGAWGLKDISVSGTNYLSFSYYVSKPTKVMATITANKLDMSKWIPAEAGRWVPVLIRLDRMECYPPDGLKDAKATSVAFYAGTRDQQDLEFYIDDVRFYTAPPQGAEAYVPMFDRVQSRYPYDPDWYYRY